ncbi:Fc receptor-like protein 4 [Oreochromis aureus]|uniref:Fc receptor-like protein 4 n=1 Tax=Oreochromis aureus TaxID=47969 RepID=UPI0019549A95|nr:Fc receptor-like protein 4 [Oreochromis aureus]
MGQSLLCTMGFFLLSTGNLEVGPKPTVLLKPSWTQIYSGETVTVRCEIQGGEGAQWTYEWRRGQKNIRSASREYTMNRTTESDGGGYSCRGRKGSSWTEWSDITTLTVLSKPKAELRHDNTAVPVGGSVALTCSVNTSSSSSGWKYYWYRYENDYTTSLDAGFLSNGEISVSEKGLYWCRGGRGEPVYYTEDSETVMIMSNRPVVTLYPNWSEINRGETITVRCEIHGGDTEWDYEWETNSIRKPPNQNEYRIRSASSSNSGNYRCKGRMKSSQFEITRWSDTITLNVSSKPKAELRADNTAVPVGGSVTLNCSSSSGWKYYWYRDGKSYEALTNGQISVSEGGLYSCIGGRGEPVYYTEDSETVRIVTVSNRPVVTLYPNWSEIYRGETITVRCEIHGGDTEWDYEWETNSTIKPPKQNEYRIRSASSSNSGNYRCKGRMKSSQHKTTEWSDSVTLTVSHICFKLFEHFVKCVSVHID